jgi:hypothetical protein
MDYRRWSALGIIAVAVAVFGWLLLAPIPRLPISSANGEFANSCCGTIVLDNGQMSIGKQHVAYVIETDKQGPYILAAGYVGVTDEGIKIDRRNYPLNMRLDRRTNPDVITIIGRSEEFQFKRVNSKVR